MTFLNLNKIYTSNLRPDEINSFVSGRLSQKINFYSNSFYKGSITQNGFEFIAFAKSRIFPVKVSAKLGQHQTGSSLIINYRPTSRPFLLLIPIWTFFIYIWLTDSFTFNGEKVSFYVQSLFCLCGLILTNIFIFIAVVHSIITEKFIIEKELNLK